MVSNLISSRIVKRAIAVCIQQTYGKSFASSIYFISKQTGTEQLVGNNFFGTKTLPQVEKNNWDQQWFLCKYTLSTSAPY